MDQLFAVERRGNHLRHGQRRRINALHKVRDQGGFTRTNFAGDDDETFTLIEPIAKIAQRLLVARAFKVELRIRCQLKRASAEAVMLLVHRIPGSKP